jgi:hypothetical protein
MGSNSTTTRSACFLPKNLRHSTVVEKTRQLMSCYIKAKSCDGRFGGACTRGLVIRLCLTSIGQAAPRLLLNGSRLGALL